MSILPRPGWRDITADLDEGMPWTLARLHGVGVLQISAGIYQSGIKPDPSPVDLADMVSEFAEHEGWGRALQSGFFEEGALTGSFADFRTSEGFVRVWYVSDGKSIALVTYNCDWSDQGPEVVDCDKMVRTIKFEETKLDA